MNAPRLYLVDDVVGQCFDPLTTTRPLGELLHGCLTFRERWERTLGLPCSGHVTSAELEGFDEPGCAPALPSQAIALAGPRWFVSSRFVLASRKPGARRLGDEVSASPADDELVLVNSGRVVAIRTPPAQPHQLVPPRIGMPHSDGPSVEVEGRWVEAVWELMSENARQTQRDIEAQVWGTTATLPSGVHVIGSDTVSLGERTVFEPGVVLDTRSGPIRIDDNVTICAFTRLAGPSYVGPGSVIFGGNLSAVSLGPVCKVRGEIEETVISGYSNKAHDGFLGHAYLGRWVNLGALTTNSDLKNNYGAVRLRMPGGDVDTGLSKVGCFLGDHVKTGIGTMLNTGTLLGAGSNVFGGRMPPTYVPPFSWGEGADLTTYRFDKFIEVAQRVLARRNVALTPGVRTVLERVWERTQVSVSAKGRDT